MKHIDVAMKIPFAMGIIPQPFLQYADAKNSSDVFNYREYQRAYDDGDDKGITLEIRCKENKSNAAESIHRAQR